MNKLTPFSKVGFPRSLSNNSYFDLVDDFFNDSFFTRNIEHDTFKIDIKDEDNQYVIEAELPGLNKEQVSVTYENNQLNISIKYEDEVNDEQPNYIHKERRTCSMARSIRLKNVNKDEIAAKLEDGILNITAPKSEEDVSKTSTIEIK